MVLNRGSKQKPLAVALDMLFTKILINLQISYFFVRIEEKKKLNHKLDPKRWNKSNVCVSILVNKINYIILL